MNISSEIVLNTDLKRPKYGAKYMVSCAIFAIGWGTFNYCAIIIMAEYLDMSLLTKEFIILQVASLWSLSNKWYEIDRSTIILIFSVILLSQNYYTFFCFAWLEKFGDICSDYTMDNILSHSKKCLQLFESLQKGLGI